MQKGGRRVRGGKWGKEQTTYSPDGKQGRVHKEMHASIHPHIHVYIYVSIHPSIHISGQAQKYPLAIDENTIRRQSGQGGQSGQSGAEGREKKRSIFFKEIVWVLLGGFGGPQKAQMVLWAKQALKLLASLHHLLLLLLLSIVYGLQTCLLLHLLARTGQWNVSWNAWDVYFHFCKKLTFFDFFSFFLQRDVFMYKPYLFP